MKKKQKKLPARHFDVMVAAADYSEPNDHAIVNSIGLANVDIEKYYKFLASQAAIHKLAYGVRSGEPGKIVRIGS